MGVYNNISEIIGQTPVLRLNGFMNKYQLNSDIVAKLEYFNPNHSAKDRTALGMINAAEQSGELTSDITLVERTSGNTGIGLAAIAAARGYKFRVYINDFASGERTTVMKAFGAEVVPFSTVAGFKQALEEANGDYIASTRWLKQNVIDQQQGVLFTGQLENQANPLIHYQTTGPEIWQQTSGKVDIVIATVGTGGTLSGVGRFLKEQNPAIKLIAVEPGKNSIRNRDNPEAKTITGIHSISDMTPELTPGAMNRALFDEIFAVETEQAVAAAREVARTDGILVGESSGAVLHAVTQLATRQDFQEKRIVVILPDSGLTYLSTGLFND